MALHRSVALAFFVALALRVGIGLTLPAQPAWDGVIYERAASQIAAAEGYTRRALKPDARATPTAFYPVGWPATLALWRAAGSPRPLDPVLLSLLGALAVPLTAVLAARVAGRRAMAPAAWMVALWPSGIASAATWMSEPLFTLLLLGGLLACVHPRPRMLLAAALFALAAYVRPTALVIAPLVLAAAAWTDASLIQRLGRALGAAAIAAIVAFVVLGPWFARNHVVIGGAVLSTNTGANLLVGTASSTFVHVPPALDCHAASELALDRCRRERALARIAADPATWFARAPAKLAHTFGYESSTAIQLGHALGIGEPLHHPGVRIAVAASSAYWLALVLLAIRGARRAPARPRLIMLAPIAATALLHALSFGGDRYHLPLVPLLISLAAARWGPEGSAPPSRPNGSPRPPAAVSRGIASADHSRPVAWGPGAPRPERPVSTPRASRTDRRSAPRAPSG